MRHAPSHTPIQIVGKGPNALENAVFMQKIAEHAWEDPLKLAASLAGEPCLMLLYSGLREQNSGRYSYLGWKVAERLETAKWLDLAEKLSANRPWHENS